MNAVWVDGSGGLVDDLTVEVGIPNGKGQIFFVGR